jgi:dolichol-phosphate mannosyltransferase
VSRHYPGHSIYLVIPVYNEGQKILRLLDAMRFDYIDQLVLADDCSTDDVLKTVDHPQITIVRNPRHLNIGATIGNGLQHALKQGADIIVIMAGNGKDDPNELDRILDPLVHEGYDFVQGSRYLPGGQYNKMPLHRRIATRLYPWLIRIGTGFPATDNTNGFRGFKTAILRDPRIDIEQEWLLVCLEYYLYIRTVQLKFKMKEVPVSKMYPEHVPYSMYTKVRTEVDWIQVLLPYLHLVVLKDRK